jgi:HEAT repeat protein
LTFLENNLSHDDTEIRIRSLKAINEMGMITDLDRYKVFLDSPVWEERLMLAKLLGAFPLEQVYPYLEELLQDENWWVRSQSARTIVNSKDGMSRLEMFIATAQDQYAIEMAQEVLVRGY